MQLTGSQVIIECLKEQGVDTVFGYPGGAILNVYDELYKHPEIKHVLTSHEQGASHAADGYARSTGRVGVCMATSGPGATNLVTGIATAYMDSIPMVAITCNVGVSLLGKDSFQEIDIAGITTPITKYSFIVKDVTKLADTIRRAFSIARKDRPGPVLVDITKDVTASKVEYTRQEPVIPQPKAGTFDEDDIEEAIHMISKAKKPYIFVGGGAVLSGASRQLKTFVERVDAPVCDTLMGKIAVQAIVNTMGVNAMAAFTAASRIDDFAYTPQQNIGHAMTTLMAQNRGAGKTDRVRQGYHCGMRIEFVYALLLTGVCLLFAEPIIRLFAADPAVVDLGVRFLRTISLFYLMPAATNGIQGFFRGMGDLKVTLNSSMLNMGGRVAAAALFVLVLKMDIEALPFSYAVGWLLMLLYELPLLVRFLRNSEV